MGVFKNIKDGWTNYLNYHFTGVAPTEVEELAKSRAEVCKTCPSLVESTVFTVIKTLMPDGKVSESLTPEKLAGDKVQGYKCNECGCGFPANVFAPQNKCPINKW